MKLKVVVVDLEMSRRQKRIAGLVAGLAAVGVLASVAVAQVPHTFAAGDVLKASELNENFAKVDADLLTLQTSVEALQERAFPASAFHAFKTQSLTASAGYNNLVFDTERFDVADEYDPATGRFTAANDGLYWLQCQAWKQASNGTSTGLALLVNDNDQINANDAVNTSQSNLTIAVTTMVQLSAGDEVSCNFFSGESGHVIAPDNNFAERTMFTGFRLN
jgi:hypothetical protein